MKSTIDNMTSAFRLITPVVLILISVMLGQFLGRMDRLCDQVIHLNEAMDNHLLHDTTEIKERLASIEARIP